MLNKLLVVGLLTLGGQSLSHADMPKLSKQYTACMDKSGGVTVNMHECISAEIKRQDVRLNKAYKTLNQSLNATRRKDLQQVQRTWIKYRDQNCDFYIDPEGGSLAGVNGGVCIMEATALRATELEKFLKPY